jgi:hypothetical protein
MTMERIKVNFIELATIEVLHVRGVITDNLRYK